MKIHKIIITLNEQIFLESCKSLNIKNIKTSEDIIIGEIDRKKSRGEEETLIIVHGKNTANVIDFIKTTYIAIDKIIILNGAEILSNSELLEGDIIVPNTIIGIDGNTKFLENTIGEDYNLKQFGLILNGICTEKKLETDEFQADVLSPGIYLTLISLEKEYLIDKTTVILQIGKTNYTNLIAVSDMSL